MDAPTIKVREDHPADNRINWGLWFGILGGPIAWSLHLLICYPLVRPICQYGDILVLHAISLGLALTAVAAGVVAWRRWHGNREQDVAGDGSRENFMALYGTLSGGLFAVAIIVAWVPIFLVNPCLEA